jgi:hypothetical protein
LFYKRLCDVFDEETNAALEESGGDLDFASYPENHRFQIPRDAHWLCTRQTSNNVGMAIQSAMRAIETANPDTLYGIFGDAQWTNKDRLSDAMLRDLIEHFSTLELTIANLPEDELGQGYEYLIKKFADDSGHTAAEFYTNRTVVHLMTEMLEPQPGECIYDHRTQKGDLGRKMRESLPNAFLFSLTGTPINRADRNTYWAFGADEDKKGYMSRYSFQDSIRDKATLPLHFEAPEVRLKIDRTAIDEAYKQITGNLSEQDRDDLAKRAAKMAVLVKNPERIRAVVRHIVKHFQAKVEPNGFKAQVVVFDRECCVLYEPSLPTVFPRSMSAPLKRGSESRCGLHTSRSETWPRTISAGFSPRRESTRRVNC